MNTHIAPRLLIPALALVLVVSGLLAGLTSASAQLEDRSWSATESQENVLVQACNGYDLTTNYTINRDYHRFVDSSDHLNLEWLGADFAGSIGNAETGKSYAYDGKFNRWSDYEHNTVAITNLMLRFEVGTPGQFTLAIDRIELDLEADPAAVIRTFVPDALQMELCYLIGGPVSIPVPELVPSFDVRMGKDQSGDDADTCEPRRGYPQDCLF
jgi:hypothetical protein